MAITARTLLINAAVTLGVALLVLVGWTLWQDHQLCNAIRANTAVQQARDAETVRQYQQSQQAQPPAKAPE